MKGRGNNAGFGLKIELTFFLFGLYLASQDLKAIKLAKEI